MDKEFVDPPQRLKTDVELKVNHTADSESVEDEQLNPASEFTNGGLSNQDLQTPDIGHSNTNFSSVKDGQMKAENGSASDQASSSFKGATSTIPQTGGLDPRFDRAKLLAEKRANELAFLAEYDAKQVRTRIKLAVIGAFIFVTLSSFLSFVGRGPGSTMTIAGLQPVSLFAALGEGDLAYFQLTRFPWWKKNLVPNSSELERRNKILEKAALDFEKSGHLAVLTRLGAEEMNIKLGNKERGLKFGDDLIAKYPTLPSNYFWRANIFYEQGNYNEALQSYEHAVSLFKTNAEGKAWLKELPKPIWASFKSGRFSDANEFIQVFEKYGGNRTDVHALKSLVSIIECEGLDVPQLKAKGLWNGELELAFQKRVNAAIAFARLISDGREWDSDFDYIDTNDLLSRSSLLKGDYSKLNRDIKVYDPFAHRYASSMKAQLALAENKPQAALDATGPNPEYDFYRRPFYKAVALQQLHRNKEALATADEVISVYGGTNNNATFILRAHLIKAKALLDMGQAKAALDQCNAVLEHNAYLMEAHLVKLDCLKQLHRSAEEIAERKLISAQLNDFLNGYSPIGNKKDDER